MNKMFETNILHNVHVFFDIFLSRPMNEFIINEFIQSRTNVVNMICDRSHSPSSFEFEWLRLLLIFIVSNSNDS